MSEYLDNYTNNKDFNKKHLKKHIEAKKKAKREKENGELNEEENENEEETEEENEEENEENEEENEEEINNKPVKESVNFSNSVNLTNSPFANTNSVFGNSSLNSPFSTVETVQDNFGFTNNTTEFDQELENEIHIYKLLNRKKTNHYNTVIKGLKYLGEKKMKELLGQMKKKFGIGGHIGMMEDIDEKEEIIFLQGNCAVKAMDFLIKELKRAECYFILHD
jgi:translation initiation factor 1 (eIF-1/SUI1)